MQSLPCNKIIDPSFLTDLMVDVMESFKRSAADNSELFLFAFFLCGSSLCCCCEELVRSRGRFLLFALSDIIMESWSSSSSVEHAHSSSVRTCVTYTRSLDFLKSCSAASVVSLQMYEKMNKILKIKVEH